MRDTDRLLFVSSEKNRICAPMKLDRFHNQYRSHDLDRIVDNAERASDFLKALAHESRLIILFALAYGEKSVTELEQILSLRQPTVSQQLARLRAGGLVSTRRDGKIIYYNLASDEARAVIGAIYGVFCRKKLKRKFSDSSITK
jgi:DNA-binding transcriptional ArsR family regulator